MTNLFDGIMRRITEIALHDQTVRTDLASPAAASTRDAEKNRTEPVPRRPTNSPPDPDEG